MFPPVKTQCHVGTLADLREDEGFQCDACGVPVTSEEDLGGKGLYLWARGDARQWEEVPLCKSCGAAIGVAALSRWEIEEEEG
jgi:hypothetical protein